MAHSYLYSSHLSVILAILIFVIHAQTLQAKSVINDEPICLTENCKATADKLLRNMNQNEDPCNNFYEYACGNWPNEVPNVPELLENNMIDKLKELLDTTPSSGNFLLTKAQQFYKSCLKIVNSTDDGRMLEILTKIDANQEWPIMMTEDEWLTKNKSWPQVDIAFKNITNFSPFFKIIFFSSHHNKNLIIQLSFTKRKSYQLFGDHFENFQEIMTLPQVVAYKNLMKNLTLMSAVAYNKSLIEEKLEKDIEDVIKFKWELEKIKYRTTKELADDISKVWSVDEFRSNFSSISFETANGKIDLMNMIEQYLDTYYNFNLSGSEKIIASLNYYSELASLLNRTPSKVIVNTLYFEQIIDIQSRMSQILQQFSQNPIKLKEISMNYLRSYLPLLIDYLYLQKYSSDAVVNQVDKIVLNIRSGMKAIINRTLLPDSSKEYYFDPVENTPVIVGYTSHMKNETTVNNYYKHLNINESFFNNILAMIKFVYIKSLDKLRGREDVLESDIFPFSVLTFGAKYSYVKPRIYLPYGKFQKPYFDIDQPDIANYGGIGYAIGHELGHALHYHIDSYYKNGTKKIWLTNIEPEIEDHYKCVIRTYSNYSISIENKTYEVDPHLTLSENLADIIGIQASYEAFQIHKKNHIESKIRLPGLEHLDSNKLFFLSYASTLCSSRNDSELIDAFDDPHTPLRFRVNGALSNTKIFAEAFQCSEGTKMNPEQKCDHLFGSKQI